MSDLGVNPEPPPHVPVAERPPTPWPASPPPVITPAARTAIRSVIVVVAALVALATVGSLGAISFALATSRVVIDTEELPLATRSLTIDTNGVAVPVRLITDADATAPRVDLRMVTRTDDTRLAVVSDGTGSRVTLSAGDSAFLLLAGTRMNVVLPTNVAREMNVTVNHQTGSFSTDADLNHLTVNSGDGTVILGGSARRIDVDVRRGDITTNTRIAVAESFSASATDGAISVEFRAAPQVTEAIASGNVVVGLPGLGAYRVRAGSEAPNGSTTVTVPETSDPTAPGVIVRSKTGNVSVEEIR